LPTPHASAFRWRRHHLRYPAWWHATQKGTFDDDIDSRTFASALELGVIDHNDVRILDLGCGAARPAIGCLLSGRCRYIGLDKDPTAIEHARANLARHRVVAKSTVLLGDIWAEEWIHHVGAIGLLTANLPYLPVPLSAQPLFSGDELRDVSGGDDGLFFVPRLFSICDALSVKTLIFNCSSLCDLDTLTRLLKMRRWGVNRLVATVAPLGFYSTRLATGLRQLSFPHLYGPASTPRQIIYALELHSDCGHPLDVAVDEATAMLRPAISSPNTMIVGAAT
jgi:SAM-dependent methyltransferase